MVGLQCLQVALSQSVVHLPGFSMIIYQLLLIVVDLIFCNLVGIEPWTIVQKLGEAIFIPAGCPHQVRNLKVLFPFLCSAYFL